MDNSILEKLKHYCAYQERSQSEVRTKLLEMKIYGEDLELYIAALLEENFVNEERFAKAYVRGRFRLKQWGRVKIIQGLKQHQISSYCIQQGLKEINEQDYLDVFHKEAEKKLATLVGERSLWRKKGKLNNFLLQRGFEADYIYDFIRKSIDQHE